MARPKLKEDERLTQVHVAVPLRLANRIGKPAIINRLRDEAKKMDDER
jgi:hypothetical protein